MPMMAFGLDCPRGQWLVGNSCMDCAYDGGLFYCPGDNKRYPCPTNTNTDWAGVLGYSDILRYEESVTVSLVDAPSPNNCMARVYVRDENGNAFTAMCNYRDTYGPFKTGYYYCGGRFYTLAATGWYLSKNTETTYDTWESGANVVIYNVPSRCTNAPASHAYYTGAGTLGGNDCPFKCDAGYVHSAFNNICTTLCTAGFTQLKTSSGVTVNVYADKPTTPALNISTSRGTCYVALAPGAQDGAINVQYGGNTYHTVD